MTFSKPVTASYRALTGNRELGAEMIDQHDQECALHEAHSEQPAKPVVLGNWLRRGQVIT